MTILIRSIDHLDGESIELLTEARNAYHRSRSALGAAAGGAAVRGDSGKVHTGSTAAPVAGSIACAERAAIVAARTAGDVKISVMGIVIDMADFTTAESGLRPCGSCRHLLAELAVRSERDILVYLADVTLTAAVLTTATELMPDCLQSLLRQVNTVS